jgi:hypothetical protein
MLKIRWRPSNDVPRDTQGDPAVVTGLEPGTDDVCPLAAVRADPDVLPGELAVAVGVSLGEVAVAVGVPLVVVGFGEGAWLGADVPLPGYAVGAGVLAGVPAVAGEASDRGDWWWGAVDAGPCEAASAALEMPAPWTGAAW